MEVPYNKNGTTGRLGESDGGMCSPVAGAGGALVSRLNRYSFPSRVEGRERLEDCRADQQNSCVIRTLSSGVSAIPMPDLSWLRFKIFVR